MTIIKILSSLFVTKVQNLFTNLLESSHNLDQDNNCAFDFCINLVDSFGTAT